MTKTIKWTGEIWETGKSKVLTVPKAFIDAEMVKSGVKYKISVEEVLE